MDPRTSDANDTAFRLGAGALGLFTGAALGLFVSVLGYLVAGTEPSFVHAFVGGALAGLASGLFLPIETMAVVEGVFHFFIGFFVAAAGERADAPIESPQYLKLAGFFGVALAVALFILSFFY
jgi:hypothetical protein